MYRIPVLHILLLHRGVAGVLKSFEAASKHPSLGFSRVRFSWHGRLPAFQRRENSLRLDLIGFTSRLWKCGSTFDGTGRLSVRPGISRYISKPRRRVPVAEIRIVCDRNVHWRSLEIRLHPCTPCTSARATRKNSRTARHHRSELTG